MACLLKNEPASCSSSPLSSVEERRKSESESEQGARWGFRKGPQDGSGEQTRNRVSYPWPG